MSRNSDKAKAGNQGGMFPTTHWTAIFDARVGDESRRSVVVAELIRRYWKPVYCYLRCKGRDHEAAKDLTQGFFHEVVLRRGLIQQADRTRGRFRTFLIRALERYVTSVHRAEAAKKRVPEGGLVSLEEIDWLDVPEPAHHATPVEAFNYAWASALLDQVLAVVERECREKDRATHWEMFRARVLLPIMNGAESSSLASLCQKYGIPTRRKASNMIITVKRRFHAVLKRHVRLFVNSDAEVEEEIRHMMRIFSQGGAASGLGLRMY